MSESQLGLREILRACIAFSERRLGGGSITATYGVVASYVLLTCLFTWPAIAHLGDRAWGEGPDLWIALWDAWWFERVMYDGEAPLHTTYLFYPKGVGLTYHSISWLCAAISFPLRAVFGPTAGYNLMSLLQTILCAVSMYALARYVVKDGAAAWLAGVIFAFDPYRMSSALQHPNLASTGFIPLVFLGLLRAWRDGSARGAWLAALALCATLLTGAHLFIMTVLAVGVLFIGEGWAGRRFRTVEFWRSNAHFSAACALFVLPLLVPYLSSWSALAGAIKSVRRTESTDLLAFITPGPKHVLFGNDAYRYLGEAGSIAYLGAIPCLLLVFALVRSSTRRASAVWATGFACFLFLSLGPRLVANHHSYDIWLPYRVVADLAPIQAVREPERFNLIARPFLAIACAFGLCAVGELRSRVKRWACIAVLPLVVLDYLSIPTQTKSLRESRFYKALGRNGGAGAIVELPLTRRAAKRAMLAQTVHGRPLVGGMIARTPEQAFRYIRRSPLLSTLESESPQTLRCNRINLRGELDKLKLDGVEFIVIRFREASARQRAAYESYLGDRSHFEDQQVRVYAVAELVAARLPCDGETL